MPKVLEHWRQNSSSGSKNKNPHIFFFPLPTKKNYPKTNSLSRLIIEQPSIRYSPKPVLKVSLLELERNRNNLCVWLETGFLILLGFHVKQLIPQKQSPFSLLGLESFWLYWCILTEAVPIQCDLSSLNFEYTNPNHPLPQISWTHLPVLTHIRWLLLNLKRLRLTSWHRWTGCKS